MGKHPPAAGARASACAYFLVVGRREVGLGGDFALALPVLLDGLELGAAALVDGFVAAGGFVAADAASSTFFNLSSASISASIVFSTARPMSTRLTKPSWASSENVSLVLPSPAVSSRYSPLGRTGPTIALNARSLEWQFGATAIEQTNGAGGRRGVGTTNHCVHGSEVILEEILDWRPFDYLTDMNTFFHGGPKAMSTSELEPTATGTRVHHRLAPPKKAADRDMLDQMAAELEVALKASLGSLSANAQTETVARAGGAAEPPLPRPKSSDGVLASVQPIEIIG